MKATIKTILALLVWSVCCDGSDIERTAVKTPPEKVPAALDAFLMSYVSNGFTVKYSAKASGSDSVLDGSFQVFDTNGGKVAEGVYRDGVWHGELLGFHSNGKLASRRLYQAGRTEGTGVDWDEDGRMLRSMIFVDGKKDGYENYWEKDGSVSTRVLWRSGNPEWIEFYEGGTVKNKLSGDETMIYLRQKALEAAKSMRTVPRNH
jgi:hypothetical protein